MAGPMPIVLIADDQPHIVLALEYLVRGLGNAQVMTATDGRDAVAKSITHRPALVLLDVMMPYIDGYTAGKMIREAWAGHPGQIWFISARGSRTDADQAREVGGDRFINKPFDPDRVLGEIKKVLEKY
jgi:DNA-binding response OmpR family regulator